MHRYRHSHSNNEIWDCPECVDKGKSSALTDSRKYSSSKPSNEISGTHFANNFPSQYDGSGLATQFETPEDIIMVTTSEIPGYRVEKCMGTVVGISTRSRGVLNTLAAELRVLSAGGKIDRFNELVSTVVYAQPHIVCLQLIVTSPSQAYRTHKDAITQVYKECQKLGGNAIVGMRFETAQIEAAISQMYVYGTAMYVVKADAIQSNEKSWYAG